MKLYYRWCMFWDGSIAALPPVYCDRNLDGWVIKPETVIR